MAAQTNVGALSRLILAHRRVEVEHAVTSRVCRDGVEVVLWQVETEREDADQPPREFETCLPIGYTASLKAWEVGCSLPYILLATDVGLHLGGNEGWVFWLRIVLWCVSPAERFSVVQRLCRAGVRRTFSGPAIEVFGLVLRDDFFLLVGLMEELVRLVDGFLDYGVIDAVVLDVKEARILGGVFDELGQLFARSQVTVYAANVNEGNLVGVALAWWGGKDVAVDGAVCSAEFEPGGCVGRSCFSGGSHFQ